MSLTMVLLIQEKSTLLSLIRQQQNSSNDEELSASADHDRNDTKFSADYGYRLCAFTEIQSFCMRIVENIENS